MKLSSLIAGAFGILGFVLSVLAGLGVGNSIEATLLRGMICSAVCYMVGYIVGLMAQQVSAEHARHVAKLVAEQDARDDQVRADEEAAKTAEIDAAQAAMPASTPNPAGS